ncbi:tRNA 5-hydroxyuridine modification protein YegQ [Aquella oligotrophica]|uniref:U32 family peptidase n=1 Tax=Aquella oligotrophica TaxID=2067065 RepID=A0A2I7N9K6_9NEIS|nr:tRNA 5-hydroxyuridine modification protein YegQ [Aquella oligotrophica]AUR53137.1 U32 family peptidase [Aquella oligotrophica]
MKKPELLLPAGTFRHLEYAYDFGADAVYAGQPRYSLRARNNEFKLEQLQKGIEEARVRGKKLYIASNILPHNAKIKTYLKDMEPLMAMKPDALIMADPGLIMMVKDRWPEAEIHLSVQANTVNYAGVKFWQRQGISRVILSRELSLDEIEEIKQQCPDMEIEVFVHGALCIAYSGRCLLSGYFNRRDPNQGTCTNACRWQYKVHETDSNDAGDVTLTTNNSSEADECHSLTSAAGGVVRNNCANDSYLLEDVTRPGEYMEINEDEHGTYIMNSKDLRAIEHVERLVKIGVDSLKIEGRTKSIYYVARVAAAYRRAIDAAVSGEAFNPDLLADLEGLANRGYTDGFLQRHHAEDYQNYLDNHSKSRQSQFVGEVLEIDANGYALVEVKNKFSIGDKLEILHPSGTRVIELQEMQDKVGAQVSVAAGSGIYVRLPGMAGMEKALIARVIN